MAGQMLLLNKRRKSRKASTTKKRKRRSSPLKASPAPSVSATRKTRKRGRRRVARRGSRLSINSLLNNALVPAGIGGAGALALDVLFGVMPLPANIKTSPLFPAVKFAGAVGLGMIAKQFAGAKIGDQIMVGAVTVGAYGFLKSMLQKTMPNVQLGEYETLEYVQAGQFIPGVDAPYLPDYEARASAGLSEYVNGMGEYVDGSSYGY